MHRNNIHYWESFVFVHPELQSNIDEQFQRVIDKLSRREYKSASIEHLQKGVFSARYSDSGRVLFSTVCFEGKNYIFLLENLPTHGYETAKFLKKGVAKQYLLGEDARFAMKKQHEAQFPIVAPSSSEHPSASSPIQFLKPELFNDQLILLTDNQLEVLRLPLPSFVSGFPGSGKTLVASKIIWQQAKRYQHEPVQQGKYTQPVYVARSKELVRAVQEEHEKQNRARNKNYPALFFTEEQLFSVCFPNKKLVNDAYVHDFLDIEIKRINASKKSSISIELVRQEFPILSGYSLEAYLKLGDRQSSVSLHSDSGKKTRTALHEMYKKLEEHLDDNQLLYPSYSSLPKNKFKRLIVDEMQDCTTKQYLNYLEASENYAVLFLGDSNQLLDESESKKEDFLKHIAYERKFTLTHHALTKNFRNSRAVGMVLNQIQTLKYASIGQKNPTSFEFGNNMTQGSVQWVRLSLQATADLNAFILKFPTQVAVISREEHFEEAKKLYQTQLIYTVKESKGLEFPHVIFHKPFSGLNKKQDSMLAETNALIDENEVNITLPQNQAKDRALKPNEFWSEPFTAIARAKQNVIIYQDERHKIKNVIGFILMWRQMGKTIDVNALEAKESFKENDLNLIRELISRKEHEKAFFVFKNSEYGKGLDELRQQIEFKKLTPDLEGKAYFEQQTHSHKKAVPQTQRNESAIPIDSNQKNQRPVKHKQQLKQQAPAIARNTSTLVDGKNKAPSPTEYLTKNLQNGLTLELLIKLFQLDKKKACIYLFNVPFSLHRPGESELSYDSVIQAIYAIAVWRNVFFDFLFQKSKENRDHFYYEKFLSFSSVNSLVVNQFMSFYAIDLVKRAMKNKFWDMLLSSESMLKKLLSVSNFRSNDYDFPLEKNVDDELLKNLVRVILIESSENFFSVFFTKKIFFLMEEKLSIILKFIYELVDECNISLEKAYEKFLFEIKFPMDGLMTSFFEAVIANKDKSNLMWNLIKSEIEQDNSEVIWLISILCLSFCEKSKIYVNAFMVKYLLKEIDIYQKILSSNKLSVLTKSELIFNLSSISFDPFNTKRFIEDKDHLPEKLKDKIFFQEFLKRLFDRFSFPEIKGYLSSPFPSRQQLFRQLILSRDTDIIEFLLNLNIQSAPASPQVDADFLSLALDSNDYNVVESVINAGIQLNAGSLRLAREKTSDHRIIDLIKQKLAYVCEVKKNAQILSQAYRTNTGFFAPVSQKMLTSEMLIIIASLMGKYSNVIEEDKEALEIVKNNFLMNKN